MLVGFIMLGQHAGYDRWSSSPTRCRAALAVAVAPDPGRGTLQVRDLPVQLLAASGDGRPTPVSGYLHAAAMVKAGVFLVGRMAPGFADVEVWRPAVLIWAACHHARRRLAALRQPDLKLLLAYGTVSHWVHHRARRRAEPGRRAGRRSLCSSPTRLFKAALFLVVGSSTGRRHPRPGGSQRPRPRDAGRWRRRRPRLSPRWPGCPRSRVRRKEARSALLPGVTADYRLPSPRAAGWRLGADRRVPPAVPVGRLRRRSGRRRSPARWPDRPGPSLPPAVLATAGLLAGAAWPT